MKVDLTLEEVRLVMDAMSQASDNTVEDYDDQNQPTPYCALRDRFTALFVAVVMNDQDVLTNTPDRGILIP